MAFNLADLFEHAVDAVPERLALVVGDERRSYAELEAKVNQAAHLLAANGVSVGDWVGLYATNSAAHVELMMACYKLRAVPVNINFRYLDDELAYVVRDGGLVGLVYDADLSPRVERVLGVIDTVRARVAIGGPAPDAVDYDATVGSHAPDRDFGERSGDDLYLCYTGGTTGFPKGVVWRQEDVFFGLGGGFDPYTNKPVPDDQFLAARAADQNGLISLTMAPLMHGAGQWGCMRFFFEGGTAVLQPKFDPVDAWRTVEREGVNTMTITGDAMGRPLIEAVLELDAAGETPDLSSWFVCASTAVVFSQSVKDQFLDRFPNLMLLDSIGSTETGQSGMSAVTKGSKMNAGGPTVTASPEATVLDPANGWRPVTPGAGVIGRVARSGHIPLRYHNDPEKSAETFIIGDDGNRYSVAGDNALLEADGSITLLGRDSVCINSGGEKIFTEEVEAAVKAHPDVYDAIIVGVPDERWGARVAAVIQPRPGRTPTLDEISTHCRSLLASYKAPRELHLVDEVRRSAAGKPDYRWAKATALGEEPT